jgi:hypothetical protein
MTDYYDDDYDVAEDAQQTPGGGGLGSRLSMWFGAFLATSIIGGVGVWGYGLTQRDVSAIPVIQASLGPAKVQAPEAATDQGTQPEITSYSSGTQPGAASAPPAGEPVIAFAPPPERPAAEDVPMGLIQGGTAAVSEIVQEGAAAQPEAAAGQDAAAQGDASDLAPAASPPVLVRPPDLAARVEAALAAESEETKLAASAAASAVQIQLGAFPERALTESEWTRIYRANEDILAGRALVVQSTISGGRRFFRLRVGPFRDRIEAQNVCRALQARQQDCLVAVNN